MMREMTQKPDYYFNEYFSKTNPAHFFYKNKIDKIISLTPNEGSILDAGCGSGVLLYLLKKRGGFKIFGIDKNKNYVDFSSKKCKSKNFYCVDLRELSLNKRFNVITCTDVIEHFSAEGQKRIIDNLDNHIENNGLLILMFPSKFYIKVVEKIWRKIRKLIYPKIVFDDEVEHNIVEEKKLCKYLKHKGYNIKKHGYCCYYITKYFVLFKNEI